MDSSGIAKSQMKRTESQKVSLSQAQKGQPAQSVQSAQPATSAPRSRLEMLQSKGMELVAVAKTKATEIVDFNTAKVAVVKAQAVETACRAQSRVYGTLDQAKAKAAQVAAPVFQRASLAAEAVRAAQQTAVAYAISQQKAAASSYQLLRQQGIRAWSVETTKVTSKTVKGLLAHVRATAASSYSKSLTTASDTLSRGKQAAHTAAATAVQQASATATMAREKTAKLQSAAVEVAKDGKFQATAAGAVGGAATLGATGGATGLAAGSTIGAVVGLVPAIFTFGLSIPIGAAIGGGAGLLVGAAVGSTAGLVGGGAAGYGIHAKKDDIRQGAGKTLAKVSSGADFVREGAGKTLAKVSSGADFMKSKAMESASFVQGRVSEVRNRLVAAGA